MTWAVSGSAAAEGGMMPSPLKLVSTKTLLTSATSAAVRSAVLSFLKCASTRRAAAKLRATVLLKGSTTLVVDPDGSARVNGTGTGWLGSAGSGDVLSGLAGALLASGLSPRDAGSVGAYLHGLAAELSIEKTGPPLVALELPDALHSAWALTLSRAGVSA